MNRELVCKLQDHCLRIDVIYHTLAMVSDESVGEVDSFLEDNLSDITECLKETKIIAKHAEIDSILDLIEVCLELEVCGYIIKYSTPRFYWDSDEDGENSVSVASYSWSSYYSHYTFGNTIEETVEQAIAWAQAMKAKNLAVTQ